MAFFRFNNWPPRLPQIPPARSWTSTIVRKLDDGPLVYFPAAWRRSLRKPWKKWLVVLVEIWVIVPWTAYVLHVRRPPERLRTDFERLDGRQAISIRSMREQDRYWLSPYERWSAVWAKAQIAAEARFLAKHGPNAGRTD